MKKLFVALLVVFPFFINAQRAIIIDHTFDDISYIPVEWIDSAKAKLFIGYGHTSHGSQITSGMNAIESYFTDGTYNWSHSGGSNELHLFEGGSYGEGYLDLDVGYSGWDDKTRQFLDSFPDCNVIIWSWCGQVNDVNLETHYFERMEALEDEYPDVKFVYMTGHLEGGGPDGSLFKANQKIREYCDTNNKILFDFTDIEKYSPDADTNYQEYFVNDACNYNLPQGGTANWANRWLANNPEHELTKISEYCNSCAHSISLNCIKKGIAAWHLWAILAGWDYNCSTSIDTIPGDTTIIPIDTTVIIDTSTIPIDTNSIPNDSISAPSDTTSLPIDSILTPSDSNSVDTNSEVTLIKYNSFSKYLNIYPVPFNNELNIEFVEDLDELCIEILSLQGKLLFKKEYYNSPKKVKISNLNFKRGVYLLNIRLKDKTISYKLIN